MSDASPFTALGLPEHLARAALKCGFTEPTPIQTLAVPPALERKHILGCAQTGTGKTAAFVWPMLVELENSERSNSPRALILAPTRELAVQITQMIYQLQGDSPLHVTLIVGGLDRDAQSSDLKFGTDVVVATPGRLVEHVLAGRVDLSHVRFAVLDEADRMLELGFYTDTRRLMRATGPGAQVLFFSATLAPQIEEWAQNLLKDPVLVEASTAGEMATLIREESHRARPTVKPYLLKHLLQKRPAGSTLVFVNRRARAEQLQIFLAGAGISCAAIHGTKSQRDRMRTLKNFRDGQFNVLIATDVAARGLDIPAVATVYNFEQSSDVVEYVHRCGRTARMGRDGLVTNLVSDEEVPLIREACEMTGRAYVETKVEDFDVDASFERLPEPNVAQPRKSKGAKGKQRFQSPKERAKSQARKTRKASPVKAGETKLKTRRSKAAPKRRPKK